MGPSSSLSMSLRVDRSGHFVLVIFIVITACRHISTVSKINSDFGRIMQFFLPPLFYVPVEEFYNAGECSNVGGPGTLMITRDQKLDGPISFRCSATCPTYGTKLYLS